MKLPSWHELTDKISDFEKSVDTASIQSINRIYRIEINMEKTFIITMILIVAANTTIVSLALYYQETVIDITHKADSDLFGRFNSNSTK